MASAADHLADCGPDDRVTPRELLEQELGVELAGLLLRALQIGQGPGGRLTSSSP